jgi:hypothetical protein
MRRMIPTALAARSTFTPALIIMFAFSASGMAQSSCPGQKEPHPYGTFTVETTSRVDTMSFGAYRYGVISCVDQNDPINFLYTNWLIPGPHGWTPPNGKLESTARLRNDNKAPQLNGCLLYGNRPDVTRGLFFGVDGDDRRVDYEEKNGCAAAVASADSAKLGVIEKIILKVKNFFPSDASKAQTTMLQLDGEVGVEPHGTNEYVSSFYYKVTPVEKSEGSTEGVSIRPAFRGPTEALIPAFMKSNSDSIKLENPGKIQFLVKDVHDPHLYYAAYEIYDRERRLVAAIDFPVFVSRKD